MVGTTSDWEDELGRWLEPFLERLGHRSRRTRTKAARMPVKMSGDDLPDLVFNRIALSFRDRKTVYRLGNHYHVVHERPL